MCLFWDFEMCIRRRIWPDISVVRYLRDHKREIKINVYGDESNETHKKIIAHICTYISNINTCEM
jgi:hypothetical protein